MQPSSWRIFYTAPRAETKAEERLAGQGIEVFLPRLTTSRRWSDRIQRVTEPLFRGYLFARVEERGRLSVLQTAGIVRCLAFGGKLASISEAEIEQLRITQVDPEQLTLHPTWLPPIGREVVVIAGPFEGLRGEVIEHRGQLTVMVRVHALRQAVRVLVPADCVTPPGPPYSQTPLRPHIHPHA
ncbi:MAG: UpxY family transcription antiterminator [Rhodothermales bacterium]|nr:UpxY family transcription antiterminator [Rhodothermales bacterium]